MRSWSRPSFRTRRSGRSSSSRSLSYPRSTLRPSRLPTLTPLPSSPRPLVEGPTRARDQSRLRQRRRAAHPLGSPTLGTWHTSSPATPSSTCTGSRASNHRRSSVSSAHWGGWRLFGRRKWANQAISKATRSSGNCLILPHGLSRCTSSRRRRGSQSRRPSRSSALSATARPRIGESGSDSTRGSSAPTASSATASLEGIWESSRLTR
mmetsp:Transcript_931/g.1875  ORF Transcript_931/g.1875 Transcript_931/m.1875 type:complete len:208 (+) Transcript_931:623-1246(+)